MMPEPPPPSYRPPEPPPSAPPVYDPDIYGPLRPPVAPVRVRLLKLLAAVGLIFGGLIGMFLVARWAGWLEPVRPATRYDTDGQAGIKSTIKYPVEPKALIPATNGVDPDAEWKRWVRSRLSEHDAKLLDHEARLKRLEDQVKGQKPPPAQAQAVPKPKSYRSMQFVSNKITEKPDDEVDTYLLGAGTWIPCVLEPDLNSEIEGAFTVKTKINIFDTETGTKRLIPQGQTIVARAKSSGLLLGNERIPTVAETLRLPSGRSVPLDDAPITDATGTNGLTGEVDNHVWRLIWTNLAIGTLRGGQQAVAINMAQNAGAGAVASGITSQASMAGQQVLTRAQDTRPTILASAGEGCNVLLPKTLRLPPS